MVLGTLATTVSFRSAPKSPLVKTNSSGLAHRHTYTLPLRFPPPFAPQVPQGSGLSLSGADPGLQVTAPMINHSESSVFMGELFSLYPVFVLTFRPPGKQKAL
jgi:hypothetical protein